jgi:hypothetical protein
MMINIHTTHALSPRGWQIQLRYSSKTPSFYQNDSAMRTIDLSGGKPIDVRSQSISGVSAVNPLVALHDIHGRKREALFFFSVPDTTLRFFLIYLFISVLQKAR